MGPTPRSYLQSVAVGEGKRFFCRGVATGKLSVISHPLGDRTKKSWGFGSMVECMPSFGKVPGSALD